MATKKFDKELYDKANPLSNGIMSDWLEKNGYNSVDLEENYGVDITCKKGDTPAFFETEIKYSWVFKNMYIIASPLYALFKNENVKESYQDIKKMEGIQKYSSDNVEKIPLKDLKTIIENAGLLN